MKFNTKTRYAIRTMIEIALHSGEGGIYQKDIARKQKISFKYLDQIISGLKAVNLIVNAEGKKSGYKLSRNSNDITTYDIYKAFEPELNVVDCLNHDNDCARDKSCATKHFWNGLNANVVNYLSSVTLSKLAKEQKELDNQVTKDMYYI